jgi:pSer/pThr/pTyr-binding forkhead associated (FHA) protein
MESLASGTLAGTGSFRCEVCGHIVTMASEDILPRCPGCNGESFTRTSLFGTARFKRSTPGASPDVDRDELLEATLREIDEPGRYLIFWDAGEVRTLALGASSMRIGRSLSADLRFEDPTVSRRHAVLVGEPDGVRVLDDRSLNGVFVNGRRITSHTLRDGDEILIGRYRLRFADLSGVVATAAPGTLQAK